MFKYAGIGVILAWFTALPMICAAEEVVLRLDGLLLIPGSNERSDISLPIPESSDIRMAFGQPEDGRVPVTLLVDKLEIGPAGSSTGAGPPISYQLLGPPKGSLRFDATGRGIVVIQAGVMVRHMGGRKAVRFDVELTTDPANVHPSRPEMRGKALDMSSGEFQFLSKVAMRGNAPNTLDGFHIVVSGRLDAVPPSLLEMAEDLE